MKNIYLSFIPILIGICMAGCANKNQQANKLDEPIHAEETENTVSLNRNQIETAGILLGQIEMKELTATIKANGVLSVPNSNKGNATTYYGGVIKTLLVQIGSKVNKGQLIASIENPQFIQMQEEYLTVGNKIILAEQELQRQLELNNGNAGIKKNLQNANSELNTLKIRKASISNQLQLMGIASNAVNPQNLKSRVNITSPIDGTVSNVFAKIGSFIDASSPIAEIVDNGSLHLDLQVFEKDLPLVKVGQTIHFTLTNNPINEYDATVFSIGSSFENERKTIAVHCKVKNNKVGLIDGMNITGIVSLSNVKSAAVPNDAIINSNGKFYIFILAKTPTQETTEKDDHDDHQNDIRFEKVEIIKGVSEMGYTAIGFINEIPLTTKIITKGAFFVNAKMSNNEGHGH